MKRIMVVLLVVMITHAVKGQNVFDSFDSAVDSNYTLFFESFNDSGRVYPFQEKEIVSEGQGALRLKYTVESIASWGGAAILQLRHPDEAGVWDFSGFENLSVAFYNLVPSSWSGRAHMRIHLYDVSNVNVATTRTSLWATEWWYSFHRVLDRDEGWFEIVLPLKDVGNTADDGDGGTGFWLTGWAGILGNNRLDLDQIRGIGIEVFIDGPLDHEFIRGEFVLDNLILNPKPTSVLSSEQIPTQFALEQNYPNPFNPSTTISYDLPQSVHVNLVIFDVLGQEVRNLIDERQAAGHHQIAWDSQNDFGARVTSGLYFYTMKAGEFEMTRKLMLIQ